MQVLIFNRVFNHLRKRLINQITILFKCYFIYVYNIMNNIIFFMFTTSWTTSFYSCLQHHEQHHFIYVDNIMNNIILFMFTTSWTTSFYSCLQHHEQHHFIYVDNIMNNIILFMFTTSWTTSFYSCLLLKCVLIIWWKTWWQLFFISESIK